MVLVEMQGMEFSSFCEIRSLEAYLVWIGGVGKLLYLYHGQGDSHFRWGVGLVIAPAPYKTSSNFHSWTSVINCYISCHRRIIIVSTQLSKEYASMLGFYKIACKAIVSCHAIVSM